MVVLQERSISAENKKGTLQVHFAKPKLLFGWKKTGKE
jgi:hypothetical protein